jgi:membrane-associated HD superfamily phosphohydrolase
MDPRERKRQRERNRYAQLSSKDKDELLKNRREARQQKKYITDLVILTPEQIEARRADARARYANLTPKQRQAIRDRQRLLYANMTSDKKQAKRNREKVRHEIRCNTISKNSIAMENPLYNSSD